MRKKIVIFIIFIVIAFFGLVIYVDKSFFAVSTYNKLTDNKNSKDCDRDENDTFQAGWDAAKERMIQNGYESYENKEIKSAMGQIVSFENNKINVRFSFRDPLIEPELKKKTLDINSEVKIYKKTNEDVKKNGWINIVDEETISFDELKTEKNIRVTNKNDIINKKSISPIEIIYYEN